MFKTISAAVLAVSVLAAPAFAGTSGKSVHAPVIKTSHFSSKVLNAHARMGRHHHQSRHFHHRFHKR